VRLHASFAETLARISVRLRRGLHVKELPQRGLHLRQIIADGLADPVMPQHAGAGELIDSADAEAAVGGQLFAGDLPGRKAGSQWLCR
jgi:hypothetical protein